MAVSPRLRYAVRDIISSVTWLCSSIISAPDGSFHARFLVIQPTWSFLSPILTARNQTGRFLQSRTTFIVDIAWEVTQSARARDRNCCFWLEHAPANVWQSISRIKQIAILAHVGDTTCGLMSNVPMTFNTRLNIFTVRSEWRVFLLRPLAPCPDHRQEVCLCQPDGARKLEPHCPTSATDKLNLQTSDP